MSFIIGISACIFLLKNGDKYDNMFNESTTTKKSLSIDDIK